MRAREWFVRPEEKKISVCARPVVSQCAQGRFVQVAPFWASGAKSWHSGEVYEQLSIESGNAASWCAPESSSAGGAGRLRPWALARRGQLSEDLFSLLAGVLLPTLPVCCWIWLESGGRLAGWQRARSCSICSHAERARQTRLMGARRVTGRVTLAGGRTGGRRLNRARAQRAPAGMRSHR